MRGNTGHTSRAAFGNPLFCTTKRPELPLLPPSPGEFLDSPLAFFFHPMPAASTSSLGPAEGQGVLHQALSQLQEQLFQIHRQQLFGASKRECHQRLCCFCQKDEFSRNHFQEICHQVACCICCLFCQPISLPGCKPAPSILHA